MSSAQLGRPLLALALFGAACGDHAASDPAPSASASAAPRIEVTDARMLSLREAEQRRAAKDVPPALWSAREPELRRAAARALARIGGPAARQGLLELLSDDDPTVSSWAAYGLGQACAEQREQDVAALVAHALTLQSDADWELAGEAIARAIGRCAASTSEPTLAAWLGAGGVRARAAALGLGDLAGQTKKLREETLVALLALAEGGVATAPVPEALFAPARLDHVPPSVTERLAQVATRRLEQPGPYRLLAARALGRAREHGLPALERLLLGTEPERYTLPEKVEALRAAARTGRAGVLVVDRLLERLTEKPESLLEGGDAAQLTLAALAALGTSASPRALERLAGLALAEGVDARRRRIGVLLRCRAARELAGENASDARLLACEPGGGVEGKRAELAVLVRAPLVGPRAKRFGELVADADPRVQQDALAAYASHPELDAASSRVLSALRAPKLGVVITAAEQIAKNPGLASAPRKKKRGQAKDEPSDTPAPPDPAIVAALVETLERASRGPELELAHAAIDAMGALGQKELAPKLEPWCGSSWPTAREHAAKALGLLEGKKRSCLAPERSESLAEELVRRDVEPGTKLVFETDAGELRIELDTERAPVTSARLEKLARAGFYDGLLVHRVDPSFVVQLGSPDGDGFGGAPGDPPLRCETSPAPFEELSVGLALAGRDTGSSQIFVMRARHPHLDGQYPIVGRASGAWSTLVEGDRIARVRVER